MDWRILAFSVPVLFVSYQSLSKLLPKGAPIFLVTAYASLIGAFVMLCLHLLTHSDKSVHLSNRSLLLALAMGTFISLGNFGIVKAYSLGAPQTTFTLTFYITLIIYATIFGILFWHEKLNLIQVLGILIAAAGIFIVLHFKK